MNAEDVLDTMQALTLRDGRAPSIAAVAAALGRTKQAVLHYFPDRASLDRALALRAVARVDAAMTAAAREGRAAEAYLRLAVPSEEDRAVAVLVLAAVRGGGVALPADLAEDLAGAVERWELLIAAELGSPIRAEVVRLVADGLFAESLVGPPPPRERVDALVAHLLGPS